MDTPFPPVPRKVTALGKEEDVGGHEGSPMVGNGHLHPARSAERNQEDTGGREGSPMVGGKEQVPPVRSAERKGKDEDAGGHEGSPMVSKGQVYPSRSAERKEGKEEDAGGHEGSPMVPEGRELAPQSAPRSLAPAERGVWLERCCWILLVALALVAGRASVPDRNIAPVLSPVACSNASVGAKTAQILNGPGVTAANGTSAVSSSTKATTTARKKKTIRLPTATTTARRKKTTRRPTTTTAGGTTTTTPATSTVSASSADSVQPPRSGDAVAIATDVVCPQYKLANQTGAGQTGGGSRRQLRASNLTPSKFTREWHKTETRSQKKTMARMDQAIKFAAFYNCPVVNQKNDVTLSIKQVSKRLDDQVLHPPTPPLQGPVKFVLGVISATRHCELRNVHRKTWMQYRHVCSIGSYQDPSCHIFPLFVFANVTEAEVEVASDTVRLMETPHAPTHLLDRGYKFTGIGDPMWTESNLKTPAWFTYAFEHFPWATHIGKMDLDTLPDITIIHRLLESAPMENLYFGRMFNGGGYKGTGGMYGEFYAFTTDVMRCWLPAARKRREFNGAPEDQVVANVLCTEVVKENCPPMVWMSVQNAWIHER